MPIIDAAEREFFEENGYVKLEGVVPEDHCEAVIDAIWDHLGHDRDDPDTWYEPPEGLDEPFSAAGMIELYHHPAMWNVRQHPTVYQAFAELLGDEHLWTSIDRVNMTPPRREEHPELDASFVHWDVDTSDLPEIEVQSGGTPQVPYGVQGVVYLDDTTETQGGFCCVPSLYAELEEWVEDQPEDRDPFSPDLEGYEVEAIPGGQGDLLIWDRLLTHGNGSNEADEPRYAQYVLMYPERFADRESRETRVRSFREREAPSGDAFPGDPRGWEKDNPPAELTSLGEKLLGAAPWPGWLEAKR